jgi:hypothetical protein
MPVPAPPVPQPTQAVPGADPASSGVEDFTGADGTQPGVPATPGVGGDFNSIQEMTGKLTQAMRESSQTLTDKEYKYVINSILSAVDFSKIDPNTKKSFSAKINGDNGGGEASQAAPAPQATGEISEDGDGSLQPAMGDGSQVDVNDIPQQGETPHTEILNSGVVKEIINTAGLGSEDPQIIAFDVAEAIYVYRHDYNENTPFIHYLNNLINSTKFRPSLQNYNSLDPEGKELYLALVQYGENPGNTSKINEGTKTIYSKMIKDIKKKLNKI